MLWIPEGWQWLPVIVAAVAFYEVLRYAVLRTLRDRIEAQVDRFLHENRIPTDPYRYTHKMAVREQVLGDPHLARAIAERAQDDGVPVAVVQQRVRGWLNEIVPQFNLLAYYKVGYSIARIIAYSIFHVHLDKKSLDAARAKIPEDAAVVYVSNHRSNADFVVTGFMLSKSVQVSYAVGEWARVWPLEGLFKAFGSYFVRRGEKDPLYHRTLQSYVQLVTKHAVTQAMFPEGGLSRDGRFRPFKMGLLDTMARTKLDPQFRRPLVFVPVGINFDRVQEDENMIREAKGDAKPPSRTPAQKVWRLVTFFAKAGAGGIINGTRFVMKRLKRHGVVAIHFGEPVVFDQWYEDHKDALEIKDRKQRWAALQPFADQLMDSIGKVMPVTPVTLAAAALRDLGQERAEAGVDQGDMILAMRAMSHKLVDAGAPFALDDPYERRSRTAAGLADAVRGREDLVEVMVDVEDADHLRDVLDLALDVAQRRGIMVREGSSIFTRRWDLIEYYANSLHPHLERLAAKQQPEREEYWNQP